MKEKFDKKLSTKIKEVVENQNLPYNPEHWELLLAKKKKKRNYTLLWRYAAIILLLISVGGFGKMFFDVTNNKETVEPQIIIVNKKDSLKEKKLNENTFIVNEDIDDINNNPTRISQTDSIAHKTTILQINSQSQIAIKENNNSDKENNKITTKNNINNLVIEKDAISQNDIDIMNKKNILDHNNAIATVSKNDSLKDINELIATAKKDEINLIGNESKSIKIGLNISPEISYNKENSNSNLGFAGGISMDIPISKKLEIYSGILYTNQKLNINEQPFVYNLGQGIVNGSNTQIKSEKAILKGIEIPINLKYNFSIRNKKVFIASGFSSTYYLEESIEGDYIISSRTEISTNDFFGNNIVQYKLVQNEEKITTPNDQSNFNLANILNVSMGIELPLNNQKQAIILEPYFKYSIRPVTQQNIDFSSAGILLRYNFSFHQK